ncbi:MAG: hypothetical protein V3R93_01650 [Candidatus Hydrothermarchaeaceae archaeon]
MEELKALKGLAEKLKDNGYTLNIFDGEKLILKVGKEAKPGLLSTFGPLEVKDLVGALKFLGE